MQAPNQQEFFGNPIPSLIGKEFLPRLLLLLAGEFNQIEVALITKNYT
jgi:hypothetical protein